MSVRRESLSPAETVALDIRELFSGLRTLSIGVNPETGLVMMDHQTATDLVTVVRAAIAWEATSLNYSNTSIQRMLARSQAQDVLVAALGPFREVMMPTGDREGAA